MKLGVTGHRCRGARLPYSRYDVTFPLTDVIYAICNASHSEASTVAGLATACARLDGPGRDLYRASPGDPASRGAGSHAFVPVGRGDSCRLHVAHLQTGVTAGDLGRG